MNYWYLYDPKDNGRLVYAGTVAHINFDGHRCELVRVKEE